MESRTIHRPLLLLVAIVIATLVFLVIASGTVSTAEDDAVSEDPYTVPVPEPGDEYYEAEAADGSWISYINPRDEYRQPYLGDGSGKICVTVLNEAGEPVVGETIPNTSVTIPTGESLAWHSHAAPFEVAFPLTGHTERPLDADQFGTHPDLPQGDGYMDSHCLEFHGLPEDAPVTYGEPNVTGEYADRVEVVGVLEQANEAWDSDRDPIEDAIPYDEAAGGWTNEPNGSHGQAVVVLQLDGEPEEESTTEPDEAETTDEEPSLRDRVPVSPTTLLSAGVAAAIGVGVLLIGLRRE